MTRRSNADILRSRHQGLDQRLPLHPPVVAVGPVVAFSQPAAVGQQPPPNPAPAPSGPPIAAAPPVIVGQQPDDLFLEEWEPGEAYNNLLLGKPPRNNKRAVDDEELAQRLQEEEYQDEYVPPRPRARSVGTWSDLPLEIKFDILGRNLLIKHAVTWWEMKHGDVKEEFYRYLHVSKQFAADAKTIFHQGNKVHIWPILVCVCHGKPYIGYGTRSRIVENTCSSSTTRHRVSLPLPSLQLTQYITRLNISPLEPDGNIVGYIEPACLRGLKTRKLEDMFPTFQQESAQDTWQFLKDIALGTYGFAFLDNIRVFFEPKPSRMQVFWAWKIKVKTDDGYEIFVLEEPGWEQAMQWAIQNRTVCLGMFEPGFELIRRVPRKQVMNGAYARV